MLYTGFSIAGDADTEVQNGTIRIQQDESEYPSLAVITMEQAKNIALATVQGQVLKMELENENGFLVYGVEVVTPEKTIIDVKIDAGSGEVLLMETDTVDYDHGGYREQDDNEHRDGGREDDDRD
ncbi:hypothetical protein GF1_18730 [Desulfolithobacter dissulfuricans]|uniref:PepSY domain-containing protein n=1 Tax=Desulfolithobacter dissulfuricans TaxID=2795293 RepID=A0A915U2U0_9BACT|nr:PepSY domain-containing protein [Desulfolithobacter dissulfuricans]BCO09497.1 hypothetical protein GF1_18730 [Desulfolithobacter dissulfuricans]